MSASADTLTIKFDNSYASLAPEFYERQHPSPVSNPQVIVVNDALAEVLNIDAAALRSEQGSAILSGNSLAQGSDPIAMAYAGHQFGGWVPQLGDGRALLLGEVIDINGTRQDIQLKGAGRTPFSRGGDGRNWYGPVLREYLLSEAMAALGVPTTRALAAVSTGDHIMRENGPVPGAILTRVARSHIRVGTFQFFAARQNTTAIEQLTQHVIERHYPHLLEHDKPGLALLQAVIDAQASLVAHWQSIGFIHGVMNTDNSSISGDTIDYGPCAFMDNYQADKVFSSIDRGARYAYQNQPRMAQWNMANLAQCLLPLIDQDQEQAVSLAQEAINEFDGKFVEHYLRHMRAKLGLISEQDDDLALATDLLALMEREELDFTITFRELAVRKATDHFAPGGKLQDWHLRWQQRIDLQDGGKESAVKLMLSSNPAIIPRNHQVEAMIESAVSDQEFKPFHDLLDAISTPFDTAMDDSPYAQAPGPDEVVCHTFCGT
ncbi:MAG: YdiU family protein [Granulosicoccus sp.]